MPRIVEMKNAPQPDIFRRPVCLQVFFFEHYTAWLELLRIAEGRLRLRPGIIVKAECGPVAFGRRIGELPQGFAMRGQGRQDVRIFMDAGPIVAQQIVGVLGFIAEP